MKTIKMRYYNRIPKNYTGVAKFSDGTKKWFLNGKFHRTDGPAVEWTDGKKEYWLYGKRFDKEKIDFWLNLGYPVETAIKLTYWLEMKNKNS